MPSSCFPNSTFFLRLQGAFLPSFGPSPQLGSLALLAQRILRPHEAAERFVPRRHRRGGRPRHRRGLRQQLAGMVDDQRLLRADLGVVMESRHSLAK